MKLPDVEVLGGEAVTGMDGQSLEVLLHGLSLAFHAGRP
jgi:hypothetical protein